MFLNNNRNLTSTIINNDDNTDQKNCIYINFSYKTLNYIYIIE